MARKNGGPRWRRWRAPTPNVPNAISGMDEERIVHQNTLIEMLGDRLANAPASARQMK
jgi:hypothetical protein